VVLFSKLESMRYPNPDNVAARLHLLLSGADERALQTLLPTDEA
jgi:hypothetical protein